MERLKQGVNAALTTHKENMAMLDRYLYLASRIHFHPRSKNQQGIAPRRRRGSQRGDEGSLEIAEPGNEGGQEQVPGSSKEKRRGSIPAFIANKVDRSNAERREYVFEMGVRVEGEKASILSKSEGLSDCSQAWIKSEVGKHYSVSVRVTQTNALVDNSKISYPDMDVTCYIDGVEVGGKLISGDRMMSARGVKLLFDGKQMTATEMRKFRFAAPILTEASTPAFNASQVGTLSIVLKRCKKGVPRNVTPKTAEEDSGAGSLTLVGAINEKEKKNSLVSSITAYGDSVATAPSTEKTVSDYTICPEDKKRPFYEMRLRYATEDILKAEGHIPTSLRPNIAKGAAGLMADYPIDLDDDDELAGSTIIKRENQTSAGRWVAESSRSAIERSAAIQREIAEIEARRQERLRLDREDEERIKRLRESSSLEDVKPVTGKRAMSDADVKPDLGAGSKRCKVAVGQEEVDGIVVLEIKDEDE